MSRVQPKLAVVPKPERVPTTAERLAEVVPELIAAEVLVAQLRAMLKSLGRELAVERGVAFIREEHLRREFEDRA
jgi:hypothetical protein